MFDFKCDSWRKHGQSHNNEDETGHKRKEAADYTQNDKEYPPKFFHKYTSSALQIDSLFYHTC